VQKVIPRDLVFLRVIHVAVSYPLGCIPVSGRVV
jgi:hypothetical protein